jgi:hypothetical protein
MINQDGSYTIPVQRSFAGGMNYYLEDTQLQENEYHLGFNLRVRLGSAKCAQGSAELTTAPSGKKQGIYGFDVYLIMFVDGLAYYKIEGSSTWNLIADFVLSATVDRIYAQLVPVSNRNLERRLAQPLDASGTALDNKLNINGAISISGTIAGLVCQDGINQPWIIKADATARRISTYANWSLISREYVPIGTLMAYLNGILFVLAPNGVDIYRSVSGRPLDFVVNITTAGLKGGDASTVAYNVGYDAVTCLMSLNSGELLVGTAKNCFPVTLNYNDLIFGEPTFSNVSAFAVGVINQFSVAELLGDYAFISFNGMRSFNAIRQIKSEGKNSIFSLNVSSLFENIVQNLVETSSFVFDNYAFFSVNTVFGSAILVYDTLSNTWVSVDFVDGLPIKQFASTTTMTEIKLYGIGSDDKVYELYSMDVGQLTATIFSRAITAESPNSELQTKAFRAVFVDNDTDGVSVICTEYANQQRGESITETLNNQQGGITYPVTYPALFDNAHAVDFIRFDYGGLGNVGWKVACTLTWTSAARLNQIEFDVEPQARSTSLKQSIDYAS